MEKDFAYINYWLQHIYFDMMKLESKQLHEPYL